VVRQIISQDRESSKVLDVVGEGEERTRDTAFAGLRCGPRGSTRGGWGVHRRNKSAKVSLRPVILPPELGLRDDRDLLTFHKSQGKGQLGRARHLSRRKEHGHRAVRTTARLQGTCAGEETELPEALQVFSSLFICWENSFQAI